MVVQLIPQRPPSNGNRPQSALDRLALLTVPVLIGALGMVLWSLLNGVLDGVRDNQVAIASMQASIGEIVAALGEQTADRWTASQDGQQQLLQALVDTAQNEQLIDAKAELADHRDRLEELTLELAVSLGRLESVEAAVEAVSFE